MGEDMEEKTKGGSPSFGEARSRSQAKQEEKRRERRPPLLAVTLVRKATNAGSSIGIEELCNRIYSGVLIEDDKQKFWVDEDFEKNCFLLLAKKLSIAWIDNNKYWKWTAEEENCYSGKVYLPAAKLLEVCWLELSGTFKTIMLSPKTTYEVAFVVKMRENSRGWHVPVNLNLILPDGTTLGRMENLEERLKNLVEGRKEDWIDIVVGTFMTTPKNVGEISFSFSEKGGHWKSRLIVKGVVLRPKD